MITLHALLVRRPDLSHDEFLAYWHGTHGPLIRDDPALARHLLSYQQFPATPEAGKLGLGTYDGITVQTFADWDAFWAFATQPESQRMNDDMANFLDADRLQVTVTADPVVVV
ncbi:EthD domain-containing protein [Iamia sp. SCSIO 61187]|uniref:EthD domain-containing protein n=1 Tax=Iamia sp. SCSIO 61187 TaxID=2722752 RepID=UPI001C635734|nr:EthD domain-containing protein [Iamia sp. SCSIO 61187]QYG92564.1 EthD domain-containing protein [Iamia sp. SCSIO 61187]